MASKAEVKERGIRIGINQLVTYAILVPVFWFILQPLLLNAMAEDIKAIVSDQTAPINNAFVALLQRDIDSTKREIATMEFRESNDETWTVKDAEDLAEREIDLAALEEAKAALQVNTS